MSLCVNHSTGDIPRRLCGVTGAARAGRRGQTAAAAACAAAAHGADCTGGALCPGAAGPIEHQDQQSGQPAPRVRHYDWNGAVQPLVGQMLQASGVNAGSILLVDSVNNRTNGSLNAGEATTALRSALAGNGKFTTVSAQQLAVAKQQLGLSPQDSLGSRSKAMGIARNVGAQYVLYSNATGNVNAPELKMQLMLVQTGEIIWSGKGAVQQQ